RGDGSLVFTQSPGLSFFMGAGCTHRTCHAMLGSREVAQPWALQSCHCSLCPDPSGPLNTGQGRLNSDTAGLAHLQDS
ncbi:hypothetical protein HGM15179_008996, partial [Zosterops borbonicus]